MKQPHFELSYASNKQKKFLRCLKSSNLSKSLSNRFINTAIRYKSVSIDSQCFFNVMNRDTSKLSVRMNSMPGILTLAKIVWKLH